MLGIYCVIFLSFQLLHGNLLKSRILMDCWKWDSKSTIQGNNDDVRPGEGLKQAGLHRKVTMALSPGFNGGWYWLGGGRGRHTPG